MTAIGGRRPEFTRNSIIVWLSVMGGMSVGPTPMISATVGMFMTPVADSFDLSRTAISAVMLISPIVVAMFSPTGGRLLDRYGVRRVLLPAVILFGLSNLSAMFIEDLWHYMLMQVVLSLAACIHCYSSYTKVLAMWFSRNRGIATGIAIAGGSALGSAVVPQLVQPWIANHGWHYAYGGIGLIVLLWGFPILFFMMREPRPEERPAAATEGDEHTLIGITAAEALRQRAFWILAVAIFLAPFTIVGTVAHMFPMLTERGLSGASAATALSLLYVGGMAGQLSSGYLLDRFDTPKVGMLFFAATTIGVVILHVLGAPAWVQVGAIFIGLGQGSELTICAYLTTRYFGLKHYGAIYGRFYASANLGIATGIMTMGIVHDMTGSYDLMGRIFPVAIGLVFVLFFFLPPYRYPRVAN